MNYIYNHNNLHLLELSYLTICDNFFHITRDVNGAGRVRVVALPYPTRWINICPVPIPISVGYPLCGYPSIFFISTGIHGYPWIFANIFKNKYLIITSNKIK